MKGLIFSEPMMQAWLEGRKSCTRRLEKSLSRINVRPDEWVQATEHKGTFVFWGPNKVTDEFAQRAYPNGGGIKPRYQPGETVYIKEIWWDPPYITPKMLRDGADTWPKYDYDVSLDDSDREQYREWGWKRKSGRFMPEKASRSKALITDVRAERIQAITPADCEQEGIVGKSLASPLRGQPYEEYGNGDGLTYTEPIIAFRWLWESLHPGSWKRNDWVWRYGLEKIE